MKIKCHKYFHVKILMIFNLCCFALSIYVCKPSMFLWYHKSVEATFHPLLSGKACHPLCSENVKTNNRLTEGNLINHNIKKQATYVKCLNLFISMSSNSSDTLTCWNHCWWLSKSFSSKYCITYVINMIAIASNSLLNTRITWMLFLSKDNKVIYL